MFIVTFVLWAYLPYFGKINSLHLQGKLTDKELRSRHILKVDPFQGHYLTCGGSFVNMVERTVCFKQLGPKG
jgi:hypothetical protein